MPKPRVIDIPETYELRPVPFYVGLSRGAAFVLVVAFLIVAIVAIWTAFYSDLHNPAFIPVLMWVCLGFGIVALAGAFIIGRVAHRQKMTHGKDVLFLRVSSQGLYFPQTHKNKSARTVKWEDLISYDYSFDTVIANAPALTRLGGMTFKVKGVGGEEVLILPKSFGPVLAPATIHNMVRYYAPGETTINARPVNVERSDPSIMMRPRANMDGRPT